MMITRQAFWIKTVAPFFGMHGMPIGTIRRRDSSKTPCLNAHAQLYWSYSTADINQKQASERAHSMVRKIFRLFGVGSRVANDIAVAGDVAKPAQL